MLHARAQVAKYQGVYHVPFGTFAPLTSLPIKHLLQSSGLREKDTHTRSPVFSQASHGPPTVPRKPILRATSTDVWPARLDSRAKVTTSAEDPTPTPDHISFYVPAAPTATPVLEPHRASGRDACLSSREIGVQYIQCRSTVRRISRGLQFPGDAPRAFAYFS